MTQERKVPSPNHLNSYESHTTRHMRYNRQILWDHEDDSKYTSSSNDYANSNISVRSSPPPNESYPPRAYEPQPDHQHHHIHHRAQRHYVADENIGTYHDRDVVLKRNRKKWTQQQNNMRNNLQIQDIFNWEVPDEAWINYYGKNRVRGIVGVESVDRNRMRVNPYTQRARPLQYIGAVDIASSEKDVFEYDKACAGLFIFTYPLMRCVHQETIIVELKEPYIAGFLAFREVAHLKQLVDRVREQKPKFIPDVILVDGHGIFHYRRAGLATHLSMEIGIPCIGIAKNMLNVDGMNVDQLLFRLNNRLIKRGEFEKIFAPKSEGECIGFALRSNPTHDLIYVSPGNRVSHETSVKLAMLCMDRSARNHQFNLPLPIGKVRSKTRRIIRDYQQQHAPRCNDEKHTRLKMENEAMRHNDSSFKEIKQKNERLQRENWRIKQKFTSSRQNEKYQKLLEQENERLKQEIGRIKRENKALQLQYNKVQKENRDLRAQLDYEWWDCPQIVKWICYIEMGRFRKYKNVLLRKMEQDQVDGTSLPKIDIDDLLRWGVDSFDDRHQIMIKIRELLVRSSTTKGNGEYEQVEGSNAAYQ